MFDKILGKCREELVACKFRSSQVLHFLSHAVVDAALLLGFGFFEVLGG